MLNSQSIRKLKKITSNVGDMNFKRRIETIINELDLNDKDKILDCGCGDGLFSVAISEINEKCQLFAVDVNETNLKLARQYLKNKPVKIFYSDITKKIPFKDRYFDKVFSTEVLEHVSDDKKALSEIRRVIKKDGLLVLTVPNHNYPLLWDPINKIMEFFTGKHIKGGFWAGLWNFHDRLYYLDEISKLVESSGFKIIDLKPLTHYCVPFNHIILYGLRQILTSGILPEKLARTADKFRWNEENQSQIIKFGYNILNRFDKLNNNLPENKSSVNILIKARKI